MKEQVEKIIFGSTKRIKSKLLKAGLWNWVVQNVSPECLHPFIKDAEMVYLAINSEESPFCQQGNVKYFYSIQRGYGERCGNKGCPCRVEWSNSVSWQERSQQAQQRREATLHTNYGVSNPSHSDEIQRRKISTNREKFGCNWPGESDIIKTFIKKTTQHKYGIESSLQLPKVREALRRYRSSNLADILDKTVRTNLIKYGVACPSMHPDIRARVIKTNTDKYGVAWTTLSSEMQEKSRNTCLEKYGVTNAWQSPIVRDMFSKDFKKEHGIDWPSQRVLSPELYELLNNPSLLQEAINTYGVLGISSKFKTTHGTIYKYARNYQLVFPETNSYEVEIAEWLLSENIVFERNNRTMIKPKELDFYLPKQNIGIEFQGTYWHMDPRIYEAIDYNQLTHKIALVHWQQDIEKINICVEKNIRLIAIWENDWNTHKEYIKTEILNTIISLS